MQREKLFENYWKCMTQITQLQIARCRVIWGGFIRNKSFLRHQKHSTEVDGALISLMGAVLMWALPDEAVDTHLIFHVQQWIATHGNTGKAARDFKHIV